MAPKPVPAEILPKEWFWSSSMHEAVSETQNGFYCSDSDGTTKCGSNRLLFNPFHEKKGEAVLLNVFQNSFSSIREAGAGAISGGAALCPIWHSCGSSRYNSSSGSSSGAVFLVGLNLF
jgi:hypothetical protein